jgi:hypothetical protein
MRLNLLQGLVLALAVSASGLGCAGQAASVNRPAAPASPDTVRLNDQGAEVVCRRRGADINASHDEVLRVMGRARHYRSFILS